jgi:hypothetical protein
MLKNCWSYSIWWLKLNLKTVNVIFSIFMTFTYLLLCLLKLLELENKIKCNKTEFFEEF